MSRLAAALRVRRRQLDTLALTIAAERRNGAAAAAAADALDAECKAERLLAAAGPVTADGWFAASAARLSDLHERSARSADRLAALRQETMEARARLSLLEQAAAAAAAAERRARFRKVQAALDDRSAAIRSRA